MTSALVCSITEMARLDGVPPNMSVSRMTPGSGLHAAAGGQDVLAPPLHVVLRADADGLHGGLRADHVFHGVHKLLREAAMRDDHEADHARKSKGIPTRDDA